MDNIEAASNERSQVNGEMQMSDESKKKRCTNCFGSGKVLVRDEKGQHAETCPKCGGSGRC